MCAAVRLPFFFLLLVFAVLPPPAGEETESAGGTGTAVFVAAESAAGVGGVSGRSQLRPPSAVFPADPALVTTALLAALAAFGVYAAIRVVGRAATEKAPRGKKHGGAKTWETAAAAAEAVESGTKSAAGSTEKKHRGGNGGAIGWQNRGLGLRFKLSLFTIILLLLVIMLVSAPLFHIMRVIRRETLLRDLWVRSGVFLDGLAGGARNFLPQGNITELGLLPAQAASIPEALYVTVTGIASNTPEYADRVWATSDPDILSKIDTPELHLGISRLRDPVTPLLDTLRRRMNEQAIVRLGLLPQNIRDIRAAAAHSVPGRPDEITETINRLEARITQTFMDLTEIPGSEPEYTFSYEPRGSRNFIFFKPVMYRSGFDRGYFRGLIRMEVSIDSIVKQMESDEELILKTILVVALIVLAAGIIGALILSSIIIKPIQKLVHHVEIIRDTEDRGTLDGLEIAVMGNDEIAVLGRTINSMTEKLVKAEITESDVSAGREIQKKFLPLESAADGGKRNFGSMETETAVFYGYYEGARGISGDYFDYIDLDGGYYAVIKCDVAGKGVPAALIVIQVATIFRGFFSCHQPVPGEIHLEELAYRINGFIEELGFRGRFAAFTLCLLNSETGDLRVCGAGDNIITIFDSAEKKIKTVTLPETPAAGALSNSLIRSKGGYAEQELRLERGDMLLLYTDGFEESKRKFRNMSYNETVCTAGPPGTPHGGHFSGEWNEEMGRERVYDIINAVMNRRSYALYRWHNPEWDKNLRFDFSGCEGTVEEVITALVAVEKMFRCYRDPEADADSRVLVDKKADGFLRKYFQQYREYCGHSAELSGGEYMCYTHLREDALYDDLAILGIERK